MDKYYFYTYKSQNVNKTFLRKKINSDSANIEIDLGQFTGKNTCLFIFVPKTTSSEKRVGLILKLIFFHSSYPTIEESAHQNNALRQNF